MAPLKDHLWIIIRRKNVEQQNQYCSIKAHLTTPSRAFWERQWEVPLSRPVKIEQCLMIRTNRQWAVGTSEYWKSGAKHGNKSRITLRR